jgi:hypothetical protein
MFRPLAEGGSAAGFGLGRRSPGWVEVSEAFGVGLRFAVGSR